MDFELSDDQLALRQAARELLDGMADPRRVRAVVDAGGGYDTELWKAMVAQGWTGVAVPESDGGLGLGTVEMAVLAEEVGAHVAPAPVLEQVVALGSLGPAGSSWSDRLLDGSALACLAWAPRAEPVLFAPVADIVVGVRGDELVVAELDPSSRPAAEPAMDRTRQLGWLDVGSLPSPSVTVIGGPAEIASFVDRGATAYAAEMLGAAARMLDVTVQYAKDRVQFDRPIGSFQAVKHRCADMLVDVEGMRSAVYYAAWCLSAGHSDASIAASTAKTWCSDAGMRVMASALQVHGGIGFTWEHDVHLYLKRAHLDSLTFGDATHHRARIASLLRPRVERGESVL